MTRDERETIRRDADEILDRWYENLAFIEAERPDSVATARLGLSDVQRVRKLAHGRMTLRARMEITARLTRAMLLEQALKNGAQ